MCDNGRFIIQEPAPLWYLSEGVQSLAIYEGERLKKVTENHLVKKKNTRLVKISEKCSWGFWEGETWRKESQMKERRNDLEQWQPFDPKRRKEVKQNSSHERLSLSLSLSVHSCFPPQSPFVTNKRHADSSSCCCSSVPSSLALSPPSMSWLQVPTADEGARF